MPKSFVVKYPYVWLCCGFAALGACLYGYEGVYFTGVSTLGMSLSVVESIPRIAS